MSKPLKIALFVLGIPIALILLLNIALNMIITKEFVESNILPGIEASIQRDISVSETSVSLLPRVALKISGLTVSENPAFGSTPFVEVGTLNLGVELFPLLSKEIIIREVMVSDVSVRIMQNRNSEFNFSSLMGGDEAADSQVQAEPEPGSQGLPLDRISISDVAFRNINLAYTSESDGNSLLINQLNYDLSASLEADVASLSHQLSIPSISFASKLGTLLKNASLDISQQLKYELKSGNLEILQSDFSINDVNLGVTGTVFGLLDSVQQLSLQISSTETNIADLVSLVPADLIREVKKMETKGTYSFSATISGPFGGTQLPDINLELNVADGTIKYQDLPTALENLNIDLTSSLNEFHLQRFNASIGGSQIFLATHVKNFQNPEVNIQGNISVDMEDISSFYPVPEDSLALGGSVNGQFSIKGYPLNIKTMKGSGFITFNNLLVENKLLTAPLSGINGSLQINNDKIALNNFSIKTGSSDLMLNGQVADYMGFLLEPESSTLVPVFTASLTSSQLDLADFLPASPAMDETAAEVDTLKPIAPVIPAVSGTFDAKIGRFVFDNLVAESVQSKIEIREGIIYLKDTKADLFGGTVMAEAAIQNDTTGGIIYLIETTAANVQTQKVLQTYPSIDAYVQMSDYLSGRFASEVGFNGRLTDSLSLDLQTLTASGDMELKNGVLKNHPIQLAVSKFISAESINPMGISKWNTGLTIQDGKLMIEDLKASAADYDIEASGWQALDQSIEYDVTLFLPKSMTQRLNESAYGKAASQTITDTKGRIIVDLKVTGTLTDPSVSANLEKTAKRAAGMVVDKARSEINKQIEDTQKTVSEKVDTLKKEATDQAKKAAKKAIEDAKKKLKIKFP